MDIITLNVGGKRYTTSLTTLTKIKDSMLGRMFNPDNLSLLKRLDDGSVFIDRDGKIFRYILEYLRDGEIPNIKESDRKRLAREANYYGLDGLVETFNSDIQVYTKGLFIQQCEMSELFMDVYAIISNFVKENLLYFNKIIINISESTGIDKDNNHYIWNKDHNDFYGYLSLYISETNNLDVSVGVSYSIVRFKIKRTDEFGIGKSEIDDSSIARMLCTRKDQLEKFLE